MRIALGVEYAGSGFDGWQTQPGGNTVQDHLQRALAEIAGSPVSTICAGRTDAGVHAIGQVVHFDVSCARPLTAWSRGTNTHLPAAICVRWAREVAGNFHARYSAQSRSYTYLAHDGRSRSALLAQRAGWFPRELDVSCMRSAATILVGRHDFSAFRSAECQASSPVREVFSVDIDRQGEFIRFHMRANAFLHHMVRNIVASLVWIGSGKRPVAWLAEVRDSRQRALAGPTAPACGLYLTAVDYPAEFELPLPTPMSVLL